MTESVQFESWLDFGKANILDLVREISRSSGVDLSSLVFEWKADSEKAQVILLVHEGKKRYVLRLEESDVAAWPKNTTVAGKYVRRIILIMDCVMRGQRKAKESQGQ